MLAILNSLSAHNVPIFQPILMIFVSKFMVHRALSDKTYLLLGLLSPLSCIIQMYSIIRCTVNVLKFRTLFSLNVGYQGCNSQNACQTSKQGRI